MKVAVFGAGTMGSGIAQVFAAKGHTALMYASSVASAQKHRDKLAASLQKRVEKGKGLGSVNPLVDIYNAVSLAWGFPVGGEDLDAFRGDLRLDVSAGGDPFLALGDEAEEPTLPGEVCYRDDAGAVCRCWNWRDGQRTMLTEDTVNAFLVIESVAPERREDLRRALETLAEKARRRLGGTCRVVVADRENRSVSLE